MQRWVKVALIVIIAVAVTAFLVIVAMSNLKMYVFTQKIPIEGFKSTAQDANTTDIYQDGVRISDIYIETDPVNQQTGLFALRFSIWHLDTRQLDSLSLRFSAANQMQAYLEMPGGYPWSPISFHEDKDGKSIIFNVDDLGFQGTGTITLGFLLEPGQYQTSFQLEIKYTMHTPALIQLTHQAVSTQIEIPVKRQPSA